MAGYTKEFLVDAYLSRYLKCATDLSVLRNMAEQQYDRDGKEKFRACASLDADALKKFKLETGRKS